jgi:hypothetical protein
MRILLFVLAGFVVTAEIESGTRAEAQTNYPWCAQYSRGGGTNCGFTTIEQCRATVFGIGGDCEPNLQYRPPPGEHAQPTQRSRKH